MHVPALIEKKREGKELTAAEISHLVVGFTRGQIADSQISAWAMAVFFQGMTTQETQHLTRAMLESGSVLEYPAKPPHRVDFYSTSSIGEKVFLVLGPLLACDGIWAPIISGPGVGMTNGMLDKLGSIPGFNVHIDERRALAQLQSLGVFMMAENADICPASRKLHALRDATGTVSSQPLMIASILSKKLAANLDRLVLDLKFGGDSFVKTRKEANQLATTITNLGKVMGLKVSVHTTPMDQPIGRTVGTALEVAECVQVLQGRGPSDFVELVLDLAGQVSKVPRTTLAQWLCDGTAWRKFISLVYAQDGDASSLEKMTEVHRAPFIQALAAKITGTVNKINTETIRQALLLLGGGRCNAYEKVDFRVGLSEIKKIGEQVKANQPLCYVHGQDERMLQSVLTLLETAFEIA